MKYKINGKEYECKEGTSLYDLSQQFKDQYEYPIILAKVNGLVQELYHEVEENSNIQFLDFMTSDGKRAYIRGICMLLLKAVKDITNREEVENITIEYCIDSGYYCVVKGKTSVDEDFIEKISSRMKEIVEKDIKFEKKVIPTRKAREMFDEAYMFDKAVLSEYRKNSRMTIYKLDDYYDYFYGALPYSTKALKYFELKLFEEGFVFITPKKDKPDVIPEFNPSRKLFNAMNMANEWGRKLRVNTVSDLNHAIVNGDIEDLMLTQEALHEKKIGDIAVEIANKKVKIVTIAGPSSSGKTTFSYRLSTQLKTLGLNPHPIALDDYFVNREDTPKDKDGKYDYENLGALDVEGINRDLNNLLKGEKVQLPTYNFLTGKREYNKPFMQLKKDDILVIEGIHGLNDKLTYSIPRDKKFKIYISSLTTLNLDTHNRIPTTEARLIRRIIRDNRTRGNSAKKSISMWEAVRRGENKNIFPFQESADAMFNSALIYELAAMKLYADPVLFQVTKQDEEYAEAQRLLKFLDYFIPIDPHNVPLNSIIREFIGGGIILE